MGEFMAPLPMGLPLLRSCFPEDDVGASDFRQVLLGQKSASLNNKCYETSATYLQATVDNLQTLAKAQRTQALRKKVSRFYLSDISEYTSYDSYLDNLVQTLLAYIEP